MKVGEVRMTNQEAIETIKANYPPVNYSMLREALDMAIALLKEQEAIKPKRSNISHDWVCGKCGVFVSQLDNYCPRCGREVKWFD